MSLVLVHGGGFAASCWDLVVPYLRSPVHAVDLPGRRTRPADLDSVGIANFVDAVQEEIESHHLDQVVLVGHSLAGITLAGVAQRIPERLRHLVFLSAAVPPNGHGVGEVLGSFSPAAAEVAARLGQDAVSQDGSVHTELARAMFCCNMDPGQRQFTLERLSPEATGVLAEPVDLAGLTHPIPRTYIRLLQDSCIELAAQDAMINNLGGSATIDLDAGHMAMVTHPIQLANILNSF